jgi:hypothetical protein
MGYDTIVITHQLPAGVPISLEGGGWETKTRRHPGKVRYREPWQFLDNHKRGWSLYFQADLRVLEVKLFVPRLMAPLAETNYPLRVFDLHALQNHTEAIGEALGLRRYDAEVYLTWPRFGVRELACTMDVVLPEGLDKSDVLNVVGGLPRAGKWGAWESTVQWTSGGRRSQLYDKLREVRGSLARGKVQRLLTLQPELARVLRLEVTLSTYAIAELLELGAGRLLRFDALDPSVAHWVLYDEAFHKLKLDITDQVEEDRVGNVLIALLDNVFSVNPDLSFPKALQLAAHHLVLEHLKKPRKVRERYPTAKASTLGKLSKQLRDLGVHPGGSPEALDRQCLRSFAQQVLRAFPEKPRRPSLNDEQRVALTVAAHWVDDSLDFGIEDEDAFLAELEAMP